MDNEAPSRELSAVHQRDGHFGGSKISLLSVYKKLTKDDFMAMAASMQTGDFTEGLPIHPSPLNRFFKTE